MRVCIVCGNQNTTRSKKYCSKQCRDKDYNKKYYKENKNKILEKHKEYNKEYYEKNREYYIEYCKKYYEERKKNK